MSLVSVIVPVYKVEQYLERCIKSILNQTYKNFELILVDDGSPDRCPEICDEWKKKDYRIKVIHKQNGGLSDARNAGLKIASGDFVAFIDSDDWISSDFLMLLVDNMLCNNCDIIECQIIRTKDDLNTSTISKEFGNEIEIFNVEEALKELILDRKFHQYVWNKLYKVEVVNKICFEKGKINEDEFWTYQVFGKAKKIGLINIPLYYYYQRDNSIMSKKYTLKRLDALEAKMLRQKYIECSYPKLFAIAKMNFFMSCLYQGQMVLLYLDGNELIEGKRVIDTYIKIAKPSISYIHILSNKEKIWFIAALLSFWKTCAIKNILKKGL